MATVMRDKKALLAYKEKILRDIQYFENRIVETQSQKKNSSYFDDDYDDDSDSENNFTLSAGPSIRQLKMEQDMLQTCLHATQELTSLYVLQSEVNVMVEDPIIEGEPPVSDSGTWREVTAECKVDLVPFSITFFAHKPDRLYGPISYRGLQVLPVKAAHEKELQSSVLPRVYMPSDAVEVLRSYAAAYRSRRTTLARLAERYPSSLFMEPLVDGGYALKCADLLEVSWTLENKWSPVAAFHHRMKFDLEYMDEAYVKIISQAHKELADPTLATDERTRLMSKIITTCLQARGPCEESMESDLESEHPRILHEEIEETVNKRLDREVMAPPKSLPKKKSLKSKENKVDSTKAKATKRSITEAKADKENKGAKKAKLNGEGKVSSSVVSKADKENVATINSLVEKPSDENVANVEDGAIQIVDKNLKNKGVKEKSVANTKKSNDINKVKSKGKSVANAKNANDANNVKNNDKDIANSKKSNDTNNVKSKEKSVPNTDNSNKIVKKSNKNSENKENSDKNLNELVDANTKKSSLNKNRFQNNNNDDVGSAVNGMNTQTSKTTSNDKENVARTDKNTKTKVANKINLNAKSVANVNDNVNIISNDNSNNNNEIIAKKHVKAKNLTKNVHSNEINEVNNPTNDGITKKNAVRTKPAVKNVITNPNLNENNEEFTKKSVFKAKSTGNVNNVANNAISDKNDELKTKNVAKSKSTNVASSENDSNTNDIAKETVKGKALKRPISVDSDVLKTDQIKNNANLQKKKKINTNVDCDAGIKSNDNVKSNSKKSSNNNIKTTPSNIKDNKETLSKNNRNIVNKESTENDKNDADVKTVHSAQIKKAKQNKNIEKVKSNKTGDYEKNPKSKHHETLQKVTIKSKSSTNSKNTDKLTNKIDYTNDVAKSNVASVKNGNKNVAITNTKDTDTNVVPESNVTNVKKVSNKNIAVINKKSADRGNLFKNNDNTGNINDNNVNKELFIINNNVNNNDNNKIESIKSFNNIKKNSKMSTQKNPIKLLNHRNVKVFNKSKNNENNVKKIDSNDNKKNTNTKIPQKFPLARGIMKNPLRISPRKMSSISQTDSQNVSKSSQISSQKTITGIPRLLKKPVPKSKT